MAEEDESKDGEELDPGAASETVISLSQMILAPLDAIFKAQVHAGRSFLSFVLQMTYGYKREDSDGRESGAGIASPPQPLSPPQPPSEPDRVRSVEFVQEMIDPGKSGAAPRLQRVSIPQVALIPLRPLAIEEAHVDLAMEVTWIAPHRQTNQMDREAAKSAAGGKKASGENRPWYLVDDPISLRGHVAATPTPETQGEQPIIKVSVKIGPVPTPSGLEKLLTTLTQSASVSDVGPDGKS